MKKTLITTFVLACSLTLNSCGTLGTMSQTSSTQQTTQSSNDLSGILGNISGIGDILSGVLGITTKNIVGTWVYQQPAVVFESDNLLTKAGGQLAAQNIATKLDAYYQKVGIVPGKVTMTFDESGNFTQTISGKTLSGTYTLTDGTVNLTYQAGVQQIVGTTQFDGNNLLIVVDMTKLLNFAKTISANTNNSTLSGIAALANGVSGMKAGLKFTKN